MNISTLTKKISDEEKAIKYLQEHNLLPTVRKCENGHFMKLNFTNPIRWRCNLRSCRKESGIRVNSWFDGTKLPLQKAISFIYYWAHKQSSVEDMKRELGLNKNTVVAWNSYLREVCLYLEKKEENKIGGKGLTVEVDETLFSRRKYNCGRILPQQWCFGGICRETKECFVEPVANRASETLMEVLKRRVAPETLIISDMWRGYSQVSDSGYEHLKVNHKYNFVDPLTNAHTQNIERVWRSVKERSKRQCGTRRSMLEGYMYEFTWRQKNKKKEFESILRDIRFYYEFLSEK
ncbi:Transposase, ISXO2-like domain-containing protein [Strongyloides ratti]|uniref:Transposase, ISXO2-like domain-containing protein n=1 Tax=Strongyloides ratti TaxID=34506 RepID=A0A090KW24_STRRB|nr:Transposase, ISXO2-like domain-containing protein [Strongyloides ratti]CEF60081.1 Transposase, ISXO2-like domain-containing protein [Strongyloides ratti]